MKNLISFPKSLLHTFVFVSILASCNAFQAECGNGVLDTDFGETCDDGNTIDADGCEANCLLPACENGIVDPGEFCFQDISSIVVGDSPDALALGDLNDDGFLDIVSADRVSDEMSLHLNNGEGKFAFLASLPAGDGPFAPALADFDGDNALDVAVSNDSPSKLNIEDVSVFFNNGEGIFSDSVPLTFPKGNTRPFSIVAGDFDQNGTPDLATANLVTDNVALFFNDGEGNFTAQESIAVGNAPFTVTTGDLDGDGVLELVTADELSDALSIIINPGDLQKTTIRTVPVGKGPRAVVLIDLDNDGDLDMAAANAEDNTVTVLRNEGVFLFVPLGTFAVGVNPNSVAAGDFNSDGFPDLVTANNGAEVIDTTVSILLNDKTGSFAPQIQLDQGASSQHVVVGDLNGDTVPDFATANFTTDTVGIFLSTP